MRYVVRIEARVADSIDAVEGRSAAGRAAVADGVVAELGRDADKFLALYPLGPESLHFRYDLPHPDGDTLFVLDFVADDREMAVGIVSVLYVECSAHRAS